MAAFDTALLDIGKESRFNLKDVGDAMDFQSMVKDFMNAVRTNPNQFIGKQAEVARFCSLVMDKTAWPLCAMVVPEFQYPQ